MRLLPGVRPNTYRRQTNHHTNSSLPLFLLSTFPVCCHTHRVRLRAVDGPTRASCAATARFRQTGCVAFGSAPETPPPPTQSTKRTRTRRKKERKKERNGTEGKECKSALVHNIFWLWPRVHHLFSSFLLRYRRAGPRRRRRGRTGRRSQRRGGGGRRR